ncbi:SusC/RagA family TonB-linked outer membrane protein [Mucilaginibacter sp. SP1R1]|uniref:SusC/RagA family TonB-linked outer membrane protein n=1 Tax=Mucilaginibacter sp. SP1R1 TaxID=2723091 RepID=UPI00161A4F7F|nr:TonB-dependent receptor [Mucilaginibacter sp. SP1R1]MBB6149900.1 TonB-linked SusC/RagA family outer membrane protein [Mucilaginibacter sp. SP1R1]
MKRFLFMLLVCCITLNGYASVVHLKGYKSAFLVAQVSGKVKDDKGNPLAGVSVKVQGSTTVALTDINGVFKVQAPDGATLIFTYVGFEDQKVVLNGQTTLAITLVEKTIGLNEVVAVGYGIQQKRDVTGATSTVTAREIAKRPLVRVEQALQGTTAGVTVSSNSGQPGAGLSVKIRGANSITGSTDPLYVIDGYIGGNIESITPSDIQSLEILKDASATAIYGSRGANGVVLITTKTGKVGKPVVSINTWFSKASIPKELDLMNAYDFARTVNAQFATTGNPAAFSDADLAGFKNKPGTDWQRAVQQKPWIRNYQADVSGGSDNVNYLVSFNHLDQPGLILNQYYKRTTFRANLGIKLNDRMDVKINLTTLLPQSRNTGYQGDITDPFAQSSQWDPTSPIRDASGNYIFKSKYASNQINPVAQANNQQVDVSSTNITGTGVFTYRILNDLTLTSNNTYETQSQLTQTLYGLNTGLGLVGGDYAAVESGKYRSYQTSDFLTYKKKLGDHSLTVTALYEFSSRENTGVKAQANNLSSYALGYYNLGLGATQLTTSNYYEDALQSFMGRVNYTYKDKYLLTASVRSDGSSHLTQKYSTFPSLAVGWNAARERFIQKLDIFSDLKLRASWGKTGNQAVGAYATIPQYVSGSPAYYFDGVKPSVATPLGSPVSNTLKWETTTTTDAGLDVSFFSGRLTFTADAYHKKITNLLYNYQAPYYLGGGLYQRNIGSLDNKGIEFALGGTPLVGKVKWSTNFTISFNRNRVVDLGGLDNVVVNNIGSAQNGVAILKIGKPLGEFYGYQFLGTWKTSEAAQAAQFGMKPGDAKYTDVNGDHKYTSDDLMPIGNGSPKYSFGFINDVSYGNFTLSFMFQGTYGNQIYSGTIPYTLGGLGDARNATSTTALSIWTPTNETNNPTFSSTSQNFINSSRFVYNASYIKLKNLSLGYTIPTAVLSRVGIRSLEIYVSGQNIWTITKYPGYDPEVSNSTNAITQGLETGVIPNPKTYTVGLRATL